MEKEGEGTSWKEVSGSISATQATLIGTNWLPSAPNRWLDPTRTLAGELGESEAQDQPILDFIEETAKDEMWSKAAAHFCGRGLEQGRPSLTPL